MEDGRVNGATRARAAIALSGELATEDRERLRIATDATVSPMVRIAMDAIHGDTDDDRLAKHLDELPEEEEGEAQLPSTRLRSKISTSTPDA